MARFSDTRTYSYTPRYDPMKPEVAALLVERFAERMPSSKADWEKDLSLAQPGTSRFNPHSADR